MIVNKRSPLDKANSRTKYEYSRKNTLSISSSKSISQSKSHSRSNSKEIKSAKNTNMQIKQSTPLSSNPYLKRKTDTKLKINLSKEPNISSHDSKQLRMITSSSGNRSKDELLTLGDSKSIFSSNRKANKTPTFSPYKYTTTVTGSNLLHYSKDKKGNKEGNTKTISPENYLIRSHYNFAAENSEINYNLSEQEQLHQQSINDASNSENKLDKIECQYPQIHNTTERTDTSNLKLVLIEKRIDNLEKVTHFYEDMLRLKDKEYVNSLNIEKTRISELIKKVKSMDCILSKYSSSDRDIKKKLNEVYRETESMTKAFMGNESRALKPSNKQVNYKASSKSEKISNKLLDPRGSTIESKSSKEGNTEDDELVRNIKCIDNFTHNPSEFPVYPSSYSRNAIKKLNIKQDREMSSFKNKEDYQTSNPNTDRQGTNHQMIILEHTINQLRDQSNNQRTEIEKIQNELRRVLATYTKADEKINSHEIKIENLGELLKSTVSTHNKNFSLRSNNPSIVPESELNAQAKQSKENFNDRLNEHIEYISKKFAEIESFLQTSEEMYEALVSSKIDKNNFNLTVKFEEILKLFNDLSNNFEVSELKNIEESNKIRKLQTEIVEIHDAVQGLGNNGDTVKYLLQETEIIKEQMSNYFNQQLENSNNTLNYSQEHDDQNRLYHNQGQNKGFDSGDFKSMPVFSKLSTVKNSVQASQSNSMAGTRNIKQQTTRNININDSSEKLKDEKRMNDNQIERSKQAKYKHKTDTDTDQNDNQMGNDEFEIENKFLLNIHSNSDIEGDYDY